MPKYKKSTPRRNEPRRARLVPQRSRRRRSPRARGAPATRRRRAEPPRARAAAGRHPRLPQQPGTGTAVRRSTDEPRVVVTRDKGDVLESCKGHRGTRVAAAAHLGGTSGPRRRLALGAKTSRGGTAAGCERGPCCTHATQTRACRAGRPRRITCEKVRYYGPRARRCVCVGVRSRGSLDEAALQLLVVVERGPMRHGAWLTST